jgi:hypothetical protein
MEKSKFRTMGVLAVLLIAGLVLSGCDNNPGGGGGTGTLKIVNNNANAITHVQIGTGSGPGLADPDIVVDEDVTIAANDGTESYSIGFNGHKTIFCRVRVNFNGTFALGNIGFDQGETGILTLDASGSFTGGY